MGLDIWALWDCCCLHFTVEELREDERFQLATQSVLFCRSRTFVILKFNLHTDYSALYSSLNRISKGLHAPLDLYLKMKAAIKTSASPTFRPLAARRPRLNIQCAQKIDLEGNVIAVAPSRSRPRGIVHYLGGAFVGAAPYLSYSSLIDRIADNGYTVVVTPYTVTFQHDRCAREVHASFLNALDELRSMPGRAWAAPIAAPVHGVGHSNGALMHAMIGSLLNPNNASNVLISFNNRQVAEAVPVPLDPLQAVLQPIRGNGRLESMAQSAVGQILSTAEGFGALDAATLHTLRQMAPAATQLGSVFDEVGDGTQEFTPTPEENQRLFQSSYSVPQTLLIQFLDDGIDQTPLLDRTLRQRVRSGAVQVQRFAGNHLTPVGVSPQLSLPGAFGPAEAIAQAALSMSQSDLRKVGQSVIQWMDMTGDKYK